MKQRAKKRSGSATAADISPLPAMASRTTNLTVKQPRDVLLMIAPNRVAEMMGVFIGAAFLALGALIIAVESKLGLIPAAIGALMLIAFTCVAFTRHRFEFDLQQRVMRIRRFRQRHEFSLDEIHALQLIAGGWHTYWSSASGTQTKRQFFSYQLNVVLNETDPPRINISNTADWQTTWSLAERLAAFLNIPLENHVS